jgi:hypothetical protein
MPATKQSVRDSVAGTRGRDAGVRRKERRPASAEIKAEIAALTKKIERELIELNARADRLLAEIK